MNNGNHQPPTNGNGVAIDKALLQKRVAAFDQKISALEEEFNLKIVPTLETTQTGIFPNIVYMDLNEFKRRTGGGTGLVKEPSNKA